jgi:hypothetical protein
MLYAFIYWHWPKAKEKAKNQALVMLGDFVSRYLIVAHLLLKSSTGRSGDVDYFFEIGGTLHAHA